MRSNLRNNFRWYKGGNQFIENDPDLTAAWNLGNGDSVIIPVTHPATALGRELVINGDFATDTIWTKETGFTITGGVAVGTTVISGNKIFQSVPIIAGKLYQVSFDVVVTSGSVAPRVGNGAAGTTRSATGTYTELMVCTGNTNIEIRAVATFTGTIDNVSVKQVNIPASTPSLGTNLLVDGDMEAVDTAAYTAGNSATLSKQTGTPFQGANVLRIARNGVNNANASQAVLTAGKRYRVTGYVRGDGTAIPSIVVDGSPATPFTGTSSTNWQYFEFSFLATNTRIYLFNTVTSGTNYVEFDDVRVVEDLTIFPGNRLQDGDMEASGVTWWGTNSTPTVTKETSDPFQGTQWIKVARNGGNNPEILQNVCIIGKIYRAKGVYKGDGTCTPRLLNGASVLSTGTSSTSWQPFDFVFTAGAVNFRMIAVTSTGTEFVGFDAVTLEEISPMVGIVSGAIPGVASGVPEIKNATFFDGSNDAINIYSADFNSTLVVDSGTLLALIRISNPAVYLDGSSDRLVTVGAGGTNNFNIGKSTSNNTIQAQHFAGGTSKAVNITTNSNRYELVVLTWDKVADQVKVYYRGKQVGATQTGLGVWVGNLIISEVAIGAGTSSGGSPFNGDIAIAAIFNVAKSDAWIKEVAYRFGVT